MPLLSKPRVIYVLCPPQSETGGPEALHQLASTLFRLGHQVYVVYTHGALPQEVEGGGDAQRNLVFPDFDDPTPPAYKKYDVPYTNIVSDTPDAILVVPEVWPQFLSLPRQARIYYWWLSLDYGLFALEKSGGLAFLKTTGAVNLCQSSYALTHLEAAGVEDLYMLSDYTYVPASRAYDMRTERRDVVLYNRKGAHFASQVRDAAPHMEFHLLSAMPREEVRSAFRTSKVYMDFGTHPGKDRMPREAASLGCYVIVGRSGAAANSRDVPLPAQYKFGLDIDSIGRVIKQLERILFGGQAIADDFAFYRRSILLEASEFSQQAARLFGWHDPAT